MTAETDRVDTDCRSVGFSGEGRCIETAVQGEFCETHALASTTGQPTPTADEGTGR